MPMATGHSGVEMFQKGHVQSVFAQTPRPQSRASETYDTEFEDDEMSDFEEYAGRTSEDSVSYCRIPAPHVCLTYSGSLVTVVIRLLLLSTSCELQLPIISADSTSSCRRKRLLGHRKLSKDQ